MGMQDLISNKQPNNDDLIRGYRAKLNMICDDILLNQEEIEKIINEYYKQFNLEKKEKTE